MVTLGGLNRFHEPIGTAVIQDRKADILAVLDSLKDEHKGPLYFPFYLWGGRQLRAQQGYLMKFPVELFEVLPEAMPSMGDERVERDELVEEEATGQNKRRRARGQVTRIQDPILRTAIENHAVETAIKYYEVLGATEIKKLGKPYDIRLSLDGVERHVEVKGSSVTLDTVELTANEVEHARSHPFTDLVVVDQIDYVRESQDVVLTSGGRMRVATEWLPADGSLTPRRFAYALPSAMRELMLEAGDPADLPGHTAKFLG